MCVILRADHRLMELYQSQIIVLKELGKGQQADSRKRHKRLDRLSSYVKVRRREVWTKGDLVTSLYDSISTGGEIRSLFAMKAYSQDLRKRIVAAIGQGKSRREVARLFNVSLSTVKRYAKQWKVQGNLRPRHITGRPSKKLALLQARLQAQLEAFPDATLEEHCQQWEAQEGIKVSITTMSRAIRLLRKKQNEENNDATHSQPTSVPNGGVMTSDLWDPNLLRVERKRRGWSQEKVAQALGVNVTTVRRWEGSKAVPYPYYRKKLAALFGTTAQKLGLLPDANAKETGYKQ